MSRRYDMTKREIMKGMVLAILLPAALPLFAQSAGGRQVFDLFGGISGGGELRCTVDGTALLVSGKTVDARGYIIHSAEDLEFSGKSRLILKVSGIIPDDVFDMGKLLKLDLNDAPQRTITPGMRNRNDPDYINARNGEAVFDISRLRNIRKINLVFFNCTVGDVKIEVFYE
jgi:hypothetical protein